MRKVIRSFFISVFLGLFAVASAQLPPEIMVDKYLLQAEQLLEKKDYAEAFKMMEKVIVLQKEHSLTLSDEFHFHYAQVAFSTGSMQTALDAVSKYLSAGKEAESYKEALALLIKIEEELAKFEVLEFSPENTCIGKPEGSRCWIALTDQPECYVWNPILEKDETVTWTGECSDGFAQGMGTLIHNYIRWENDDAMGRTKTEEIGQLQNGKKHGHWVESFTGSTTYKDTGNKYQSLSVAEGPIWRARDTGIGSLIVIRSYMKKAPMWRGKKHGGWIHYFSDGSVEAKGSYVNNERHGHWVVRLDDRQEAVSEGLYVNGKMHGRWVRRYYLGHAYAYSGKS